MLGIHLWTTGEVLRTRAFFLQHLSKEETLRTSSELEALQLRESLDRSEAMVRTLMGSSGDCMKLLDREGRLVAMNEPGQKLLGICDLGLYLNTCWVDWWKGADHLKAKAAVAAASEGGVGRFVAFGRTPGGEDKWWDVVVTAVGGTIGGADGYLSVSRDITESKLAEEELRLARDAAETSNRAKDHFLAMLSHELRTPLSPVLSMAQMMEGDLLGISAGSREAFAMIRRNVELQSRLIDDLLDITRISRGKLEVDSSVVNLEERLREVVGMVEKDVEVSELTLVFQAEAKGRQVRGDKTRLSQIFWNVLKNAIKFTPRGGRIVVSTRNPSAEVIEISVADSGIGIEAEVLPKIFAAFEQGGRDVTRLYGGLGLGLSITKALVDLHGGSIAVKSEGKGKGAEFTISLPTTSDAMTEKLSRDGAGGEQGTYRILLVEDHVDTARVMSRVLAASGHSVRMAHTVESAKELAGTETFDLLISDLGLPDGSGLELMSELRGRMEIRGIALTGFGMEEDLQQTRSAGFAEHLVKPVDLEELEQAIRRVGSGG